MATIGELLSGANSKMEGFSNMLTPTAIANIANAGKMFSQQGAGYIIGPSGAISKPPTPGADMISNIAGGQAQAAGVNTARDQQLAQLVNLFRPQVQPTVAGQNHVPDEAPVAPAAPASPAEAKPEVNPMEKAISNIMGDATKAAIAFGQTPSGEASPMFKVNPALNPSAGEAASGATTSPTIEASPDGRVDMSNVQQILSRGNGMPDPTTMGAVTGAFGPEIALKAYDILHNAQAGDTSRMSAEAAMMNAQNEPAYKLAQIRKLNSDVANAAPHMQVALAGQKKLAEATAEVDAKRASRYADIAIYKAGAGKNQLPKELQGMLGVKTFGEAAEQLGDVANIHTLVERSTALRVADKHAAGLTGAADLTRLGEVAKGYISVVNDVNGDIAKAEGNYQLMLTGTDQEKAAYTKYKEGLYKTKADAEGKLADIQNTLTNRGMAAAGATATSRRRPTTAPTQATPTSSKAEEAKAYGVASAIPKGTGVPQLYKGKTIYITNGAAYDADGNFIAVLTNSKKKK
jgi:hypothetical protein